MARWICTSSLENGGGRIEWEMAAGNGRTGLAAFWKDQVFAIEMKIKRRKDALEKGLDQLWSYLDRLGQQHGYLVLFETKTSEEMPWEERIKWEELTHKGKRITVLEM